MSEIDRRQQILEGALEVFSTQGFHKSSIKQIARAAGIKSSALIYHYFDDKKALLNAVMQELSPVKEVDFLKPGMQETFYDIPPEILLTQIASTFLSLIKEDPMRNMVRLFLSEAVRMPDVAVMLIDTQKQLLHFLEGYLQHQQTKGLMREHDVTVSARAFIGLLIVNLMVKLVFVPLSEGMPDNEAYVKEVIQIFLNGVRSEQ